jgi:heme/copper-type cytochrome/quinol oxidase subunit 2
MKIFKISCYSNCGTYFSSYLKSITIIADDKFQAIIKTKEFLENEGENFLYNEDKWQIETLCNKIGTGKIIDCDNSSDY